MGALATTDSPLGARSLLRAVAIAGWVALAAWVAVRFTGGAEGLTAIWLGNGVVAGALLPLARRHWPLVLASAAVAEFATRVGLGEHPATAATLAAANGVEILIVAAGIRRWFDNPLTTDRVIPLTLAATGSALVASGVSALVPAFLLDAGRVHGALAAWGLWFSVHVVGIVMMATLVTVAGRLGARLWGRPGRRFDYAVCHLVLLAACALVFLQTQAPVLFLVFPPLVLLTFRHGFPGSITGIAIVAAASTISALSGEGPFTLLRDGNVHSQILLVQLFVASTCLISMPIATVLTARRRLARKLQQSEENYRLLADNTRDLVVRIGADGSYPYVSRSVTQLLGWSPEDFAANGPRLLHPAEWEATRAALRQLFEQGGSRTLLFRVRHSRGHYVWIEAVAARVEHVATGAPIELVASGRDVTYRVTTQMALDASQRRLQAITNTLPALVCYIDRDGRYTFANEHYQRLLGIAPADLLGRTVRETRGDDHLQWEPYVRGALAGEPQVFDVEPSAATGGRYLQSHYVPDVTPDGEVAGFHAFTFDISDLKTAEKELTRLARVDPLTGLGNRRMFEERMDAAILRARRRRLPLAMVYLDLDRFKEINDTLGHLGGDAVLRAFAERIRACVYEVDLVARLGGDEFVIVVEDAPDVAATETMARKILAAMESPVEAVGQHIHVGTSIGIAFCADPVSTDGMLAIADRALYAAKAAGRNGFRVETDAVPPAPDTTGEEPAGAGLRNRPDRDGEPGAISVDP